MRPDHEMRHDIEQNIDRDPQIGTCHIAVSVRNGVATLAGFVHSYGDRSLAEAHVKRVRGVAAIANDIEVRLPLVSRKPDPEIADEVVAGLRKELPVAFEQVWPRLRVRVVEGRVTLQGEVEWEDHRRRAEEVALRVRGIKSIRNDIVIKPQILSLEIKQKIEEVLQRKAEIDADSISVETADNGTIILVGQVHSIVEREQVERAAWSAPGVRQVDSRIAVVE